jgi:GAF domain-containing protein
MEIVINLVGAHSFAIYLVEPQEGHLRPAMAEGVDLASLKPLPLEGSVAGKAVRTGELYVNDSLLISGGSPENPIVVVPLLIKGEPIGAVILFKMLPQKKKFAEVDRELFNLLAGHAATALFASKLYTETERKRRTMQGFIDLLTR